MTPAEFLSRMQDIFSTTKPYDIELDHRAADALMCEVLRSLGYGEGVAVFESALKWYA